VLSGALVLLSAGVALSQIMQAKSVTSAVMRKMAMQNLSYKPKFRADFRTYAVAD